MELKKIPIIEKPFSLNIPEVSPGAAIKKASTIPGIHIVANFEVVDKMMLESFSHFRTFIDQQIANFGLTSVGEVYHDFPNGG
jgi:S-adenosylmethionine decarboxylase